MAQHVSTTALADDAAQPVIVIEAINTFRHPVHALRDVDMTVDHGITCVVGPNGAGKTTLLKSIMGLLKVKSGRIEFRGRDITNQPAHKIAKSGIGYVPEDRRIYPDFTVRENILLATWGRKTDNDAVLERAFTLFPKLRELIDAFGMGLSGGERTMLAIARTLALEPTCLLLDEPLEGLAPLVREHLAESISELRAAGLTTMTTASDLSYVPAIANVIYMLERGQIIQKTAIETTQESSAALPE